MRISAQRIAHLLISYRRRLFVAAVVLAGLAFIPATQIEFDRSVENMFAPDDPLLGPYRKLKRTFGGRLAFHGCISTAGPVACGTVDDVVDDCRQTLDIMMPGGGYCFAPTHCLQDNSPTANVVAMYDTVDKYGWY